MNKSQANKSQGTGCLSETTVMTDGETLPQRELISAANY